MIEQTPDQSPAAVAATYFDALGRGDVPTAMAQLSPDVTWHQPGANQFSGDHRGLEGVGALLGGMMEASQGSFVIDSVHALMGNGDMVAASIHFAGRIGDSSMSMDGVDVVRLADGKIVEMWLFSGDQAAEDAFWGK